MVGLDSEVSTPLPIPRFENRGHPLSGFGSLSEFHPYITAKQAVIPRGIALFRPFRGSFPFDVSQPRGATYPQRVPSRWLRCALRVSHPLDALLPSRPPGLVPSRFRPWGSTLRGLVPRLTPYALSSAAPLRVSPRPKRRGRPFRDTHAKRSPASGLGTSQMAEPNASLGFPAPGLAALNREERSRALSSPLALFRLGRTLTGPLAPQGFSC
jgi:hypothetical protein